MPDGFPRVRPSRIERLRSEKRILIAGSHGARFPPLAIDPRRSIAASIAWVWRADERYHASMSARAKENPICRALVLCREIALDASGEPTLVGVFTQLVVPDFPARVVGIGIYACVTELHGDPDLRIRLIQITPMDINGQSLSVSGRITPDFSDPLEERNIVVTLTEFVLPAPGRYEVALESDGSLIGKRKFEAFREGDSSASAAAARKARFTE
jgi:hypothetical protein